MTGGQAWQPQYVPLPGRCWACSVVVAPVGKPRTVYACAACIADPPRPHRLMVAEQAEPVGWVMPRNVVTANPAAWRATSSQHGGGNTTFHPGGVIPSPVRHACCGGMSDRGHTTTCPDHGIWMETEPARPRIGLPQRRPAKAARPGRSLAKLAGSVGDSTSWGLLATWVGWLVIPGIGYVHAVHLSLIILAAAATILTVAGMCGYGRKSRED